jgi:hypothetical protein
LISVTPCAKGSRASKRPNADDLERVLLAPIQGETAGKLDSHRQRKSTPPNDHVGPRRGMTRFALALIFGNPIPWLSEFSGSQPMCTDVGVAKRIDLESISKDVAKLVESLHREVEGDIKVEDIRKIEAKLKKLVE